MKIIKKEVALAVHYAQENTNESLTQIAKRFAIDRHTLAKYLNIDFSHWIFDDTKQCYIELEPYEMAAVEEFKSGILTSVFQVKKKYGIHSDRFKILCGYCGVSVKHTNNTHHVRHHFKHHFNRNAFASIETEEDAYILGFITADGYLSESTNVLFIKLHTKDEDILKKICQYLEYDGEIKHITHNLTHNPQSRVIFCSAQLIENLKQYGLCQNKSLKEKFYGDMSYALLRHYIRGLIDGDGFIGQKTKTIGLCGSKDIVKSVTQHLTNQLNLNLNVERKVVQRNDTNLYTVEFTGNNAIKVMKYLYEDSRIYLDRKYDLAKRYF